MRAAVQGDLLLHRIVMEAIASSHWAPGWRANSPSAAAALYRWRRSTSRPVARQGMCISGPVDVVWPFPGVAAGGAGFADGGDGRRFCKLSVVAMVSDGVNGRCQVQLRTGLH